MASLVFDNGLRRIGVQASKATAGSGPTYDVNREIQTMSVDDQTSAFLSTDTSLDRGGALTVTNEFDKAFDATPTRGTEIVTHVTTFASGEANFTVRRIALHDDTAATVDATTDTLVCGIDGQSLAKTADFSMEITVTLTYVDST